MEEAPSRAAALDPHLLEDLTARFDLPTQHPYGFWKDGWPARGSKCRKEDPLPMTGREPASQWHLP